MRITKKDLEKVERKIRKEAEGRKDIKRLTFLKATHNRYSKEHGEKHQKKKGTRK